METSKRAVDAYKRTRLVDLVITDDDKVAPMYRMDEIAEMLRTSTSDLIHEVVEYTMKRLSSKSPRVKQKVLRMIKFVVGKGGPEFKRQVQRQSAVIRQLFDYKGQPDPLRGDALNKAVRDTAHEAINAIFASDDKPPQGEEVNKRIMGFGSTNNEVHMSMDGKKSSISDVMSDVIGFGSASIKQGLTILSGYTGANTVNVRNDAGTYKGPSLMRSLTSDRETFDRGEIAGRGDSQFSSGNSNANAKSSTFNSQVSQHEARVEVVSNRGGTSPEEKLLDTITAPGGMRLQPTRENLQKFLANIVKLDRMSFCYALESKLQSHAWQVRFKTLCVIETILRQTENEFFEAVVQFFEEDSSVIKDCLQSPQTSVKEKALKVLGALSEDPAQIQTEVSIQENNVPQVALTHDMPDLMDAGASDLWTDAKDEPNVSFSKADDVISNLSAPTNDLLVDWAGDPEANITENVPDDVFSGVSFHTDDKAIDESTSDLFSGLSVENATTSDGGGFDLLNGLHDEKSNFGSMNTPTSSDTLADLMESVSSSKSYENINSLNGSSNALRNPSVAPSLMLPMGMMGGYQAPIMMHQNFGLPSSNPIFQQQLLAGMAGFQRLNLGMNIMNGGNSPGAPGSGGMFGNDFDFSGDASSRFPIESVKKEDTKAFDFISDHVSAARVTKKSS